MVQRQKQENERKQDRFQPAYERYIVGKKIVIPDHEGGEVRLWKGYNRQIYVNSNDIIYSKEEDMYEILNKKFQSVFVQNPYRDMANTCTNAKNIGNINLKKMK